MVQGFIGKIEDLQDNRFVDVEELESRQLDHPRTVCTHKDCTRVETLSAGSYERVAITSCHRMCHLEDVQVKAVGDGKLAYCAAMVGDQGYESATCSCGHSYRFHQHERVDYVKVTKRREDEATKRQINEENRKKISKEEIIAQLEKEQEAWKAEQEIVVKTMAKFAHFLGHNGILSINDAMDDYILFQIQEQEDIKARLPPGESNQEVIDGLKQSLEEYRIEKGILESALHEQDPSGNEDGGVVSILDAKKAVKQLNRLPLVGRSIEDAIAAEQQAVEQKVRFEQFSVPSFGSTRDPYRSSRNGRRRGGASSLLPHNSNPWRALSWY